MSLTILVSLLVCIIGAVIYVASTNGSKMCELGRIAYAMGLLACLLSLAGHAIHIGTG
jgi:hypothetical protein